jgi:hypothetical protein
MPENWWQLYEGEVDEREREREGLPEREVNLKVKMEVEKDTCQLWIRGRLFCLLWRFLFCLSEKESSSDVVVILIHCFFLGFEC